MVGIAAQIELASAGFCNAENSQNALRVLIGKAKIKCVQLNSASARGRLGKHTLKIRGGNEIQNLQMSMLVDEMAGEMGDSDLVEGQIHVQYPIQSSHPRGSATLVAILVLGGNGKSAHVHVRGGNDNKIKIIHTGQGHAQNAVHPILGFASKQKCVTVCLGQRLRLCDIVIILGQIPIRRPRNGSVPLVIGQAYGAKLVAFGVVQNRCRILLGITGAAGQAGMNVQIVINLILHKS